jgi:hypothetical protein
MGEVVGGWWMIDVEKILVPILIIVKGSSLVLETIIFQPTTIHHQPTTIIHPPSSTTHNP